MFTKLIKTEQVLIFMQSVKIPNIPRVSKHSFHFINESYSTRFFKNAFKQPYAATNYKKFLIGSRGPHLYNKFQSENRNTKKVTSF